MKKKFLSVLCALCLILGLLPVSAMALAAEDTVYVCGIALTDGKCLVSNSAEEATDYNGGNNYVARFENGVLYLNGLVKTYAGQEQGYRVINWSSGKLTIRLADGSVNMLQDTNYAAINGTTYADLIIEGGGTLNVTGKSYAIWVQDSITIQKGATVNATGGTQAGISINSNGDGIYIKQGTNVTASGTYGVATSNNYNRSVPFKIEGGNFAVSGTSKALYRITPDIEDGVTVYVDGNADGSTRSPWDRQASSLTADTCKYISMSGFSTAKLASTYKVTSEATSTGTFEVNCPGRSLPNETVTITADPDDNYEVNTVTVTGASGNVAVSGTGNTRSFTMPEEDVSVAVSFKATRYSITYNLDGGTNANTNPESYTVETDDITLADPSKSGYTFEGWFDNSALTGSVVTTIAKGSTGDKTFWAKWSQNQSTALEDVTFGFAYDVQRSPAYPAKDDTITASGLTKPLDTDGITSCASSEGSWTLTRAGTYAYVKSLGNDSAKLQGVVNSIVSNYDNITADEVVLHELQDGSKHIAYGVVVAYDADEGIAIYLGGNRSGGAGYLLSTTAQSGGVTANADQVATDFVPTRSIALDKTGTHTFAGQTAGYAESDLTALTVTVSNSGNTATGALNVSLSGADADSFELGNVDNAFKAGIASQGSDSFTVVPQTGLTAGTYTATVTVSGVNVASKSFEVSFTVTAPVTYTVTFNANGGTGTMADQTYTHGEAQALRANTFVRSSYTFAGWATSANGDVVYTDGQSISLTEDTDLYAKWTWNTDGAVEDLVFTHAYDAWRTPSYPAKGDTIRLYNLDEPLMDNGSAGTVEGDWTLTEVGTYYTAKNDPAVESNTTTAQAGNLEDVVNGIAANYSGITADEIIIHELKVDGVHVAYGVIAAYDAATGRAVFLGDTWGGGAGYLLSVIPYQIDGETTMTATDVPTDFIGESTYRIELDTVAHTFATVTVGYGEQTPATVTVSNTGTASTGALTVVLSGDDADCFTLNKRSIADIAVDGEDTFTVVPKTGLSAGTYTATVTVSGDNVVPKTVRVTFTVNNPAPVVYTVTFDANGGSVSPTSDTTNADGTLSRLPTPTHRGSYEFKGWYTAARGGTKVTTSTVFTEDTTIYARWTYTGSSGPVIVNYAVIVEDADNGEVSSNYRSAASGTVVTIQVAPDEGYALEKLTVTSKGGKEIELTDKGDGKYTFRMPAASVTVQAVFEDDGSSSDFFEDVPEGAYYYDAVQWAVETGITDGTGSTLFNPDLPCTRAQMITFLWRAVGSPEPVSNVCPFTDVSMDSYYGKAVLWGVEQGLVKGTSATTYSPDMICTRAHMATLLCRLADGKPVNSITSFTDVKADAYYAEAVQWAVELGIIEGTGNGKFSPDATCTRAHMITFLYRYFTK